jgi:hypothetical protein
VIIRSSFALGESRRIPEGMKWWPQLQRPIALTATQRFGADRPDVDAQLSRPLGRRSVMGVGLAGTVVA